MARTWERRGQEVGVASESQTLVTRFGLKSIESLTMSVLLSYSGWGKLLDQILSVLYFKYKGKYPYFVRYICSYLLLLHPGDILQKSVEGLIGR